MQSYWRPGRAVLLAATFIAALVVAPAAQAQNYGKVLIHGQVTANAIRVDPLKGFGQSPFGHLHSYCGSGTFSENLTLPQMVNGTTSFFEQADKSGLWFPTPLKADGTPVAATDMQCAYYLANRGYDILGDPPNGLKFVGGNPEGTGPYQSVQFYGSHCSWFKHTIPTAGSGCSGYEEEIDQSNQCWDGEHYGLGLGSADAAFATGIDPNCYPVPAINFVLFVGSPGVGGCLSSDVDLGTCTSSPGASGHFDYVFDWGRDPATGQSSIGEIINGCLDVPDGTNPNTYGAGDAACTEFPSGNGGHYIRIQAPPPNVTTYGAAIEGDASVGG